MEKDDRLLQMLRTGGKQKDTALQELMKILNKPLRKYILSGKGSQEDFEDLLYSTLEVLCEKLATGGLRASKRCRIGIFLQSSCQDNLDKRI